MDEAARALRPREPAVEHVVAEEGPGVVGHRRGDPGPAQAAAEFVERKAAFKRERPAPDNGSSPGPVRPPALVVVDVESHGFQGDRLAGRGQAEHQERIGPRATEQAAEFAVRVPEIHREHGATELASDLPARVDPPPVPRVKSGDENIHA